MKSHRLLFRTLQGVPLVLILLLAATWLTTYHPGAVETDTMQSVTAEVFSTIDGNDPVDTKPDRRLDYLFYAQSLRLENALVLQAASWRLSDHFPTIAELRLPTNAAMPSTTPAIRS